SHGTTYGGSPLSCAVATAVIEEILEKDLSSNARVQGEWIMEQLNSMDLPLVSEARGKGLMIGLVLDQEAITRLPNYASSQTTPSAYLFGKLNEAGLLTVPAGPGVIRWLPPLNITRGEAETAIFMLKTALERLTSRL